MNVLSGAEFKILWYILRHTYGFQKNSDTISIPQIMKGIKKKTGEVLDVGTGIKDRTTVINALRKLEQWGFIKSEKRLGKTTRYYPLVQKPDYPSRETRRVGSRETRPTINNITIDNTDNTHLKEDLKNPFKVSEEKLKEMREFVNSQIRINNGSNFGGDE